MFSDGQTRPKQPNPNNPKPKSHQPQTSPYWLSDQLGKCWALQDRACVNRRRGSMPREASSSLLFTGNPFHSRMELTGFSPAALATSPMLCTSSTRKGIIWDLPLIKILLWMNLTLGDSLQTPQGPSPEHTRWLCQLHRINTLFCSVTQQLCLGWKTVLLILLKEIQCCGRAPCLSACGAGYWLL